MKISKLPVLRVDVQVIYCSSHFLRPNFRVQFCVMMLAPRTHNAKFNFDVAHIACAENDIFGLGGKISPGGLGERQRVNL